MIWEDGRGDRSRARGHVSQAPDPQCRDFRGRPAIGTRISASGRPGPGGRCSTRCARSRSASPSSALKRGDKIAIIGANRPRLYWAMCAAQALGAVPVPIYADSVADEMAYVLEHAEVTVAVVEDQEQVDKMLSIRSGCPGSSTSSMTSRAACATTTTRG